MTTTNFRKVLIDIANEENSNRISKIIAYYYPRLDISSRENLFESLMNFLQLSENQEFDFDELLEKIKTENIDVSQFIGKDYRIKKIEISNLRGIPSKKHSNEIPYGINFTDEEGKINNAIILANNGTGKSSVFSGLEMIYAQEIGEKKLRSKNPDDNDFNDYSKYLQRINETGKPYCNVKTFEGDFDLENKIFNNKELLKIFNPSSHFITEYDVISNGWLDYSKDDKYDYSFHNIIAKALGLDEFLTLQNIAQQVPNYRRNKETTSRNNIDKEIENNIVSIKNKNVDIQSKSIEFEELKKGINTENINNQKSKLENLNKLQNKIFDVNFNETNYINEIFEFENKFKEYSSLDRNKRATIEKNFLDIGKDLIHEFDNCPFCLSSNKTIDEIKIEVEKRLLELEQYKSLDEDLKNKFRLVADNLWNITRDLSVANELLNIDRQELVSFSNLEKIRLEENRLYIALSSVINDNELNDYVYSFTQKQIPTDKDYNDLFELLSKNKEIFEKRYVELSKEVGLLINNRKNGIETEIKLLLENNDNLSVDQKVTILEREIKELNEQIVSIENKNKQLELDLKVANKKVSFLIQIKKEIEIFNSKLKLKVDELVNNGFEPIKNTVEEILNQYFQDDSQYKLEINLKENKVSIEGVEYVTKYIVAEIIDINNNTKVTSPQNYFNTFRFKLFCLMISLSIALASRKTYKINLPLVMDDLFFASDFINKNSFSEFLQKVIKLFYKHTPAMPLQFILFTHDDLIFRTSIDCIENLSITDNQIKENTLFGRMFKISTKNSKTDNLENEEIYNELLYTIPNKILIN